MAVNRVANLNRAIDNCTRIYLMVQEQIANPSQANIDAIVAAATDDKLTPKPSYSLDGESYSWPDYSESLLRQMEGLQKLVVIFGGPYEVRTLGKV